MKKPPPVKAFANRNLYASAKHHAFPACGTLSSKKPNAPIFRLCGRAHKDKAAGAASF
jgi:hypothetical protein